MAIVAGTTPKLRIVSSTSFANFTLLGYGNPCEIMVDSRATIGLPESSAF